MHSSASAALILPGLHGAHAAAPAPEKRPAVHVEQLVAPAVAEDWNRPALQPKHTVAPVEAWYWPEAQGEHAAAPAAAENLPAGQGNAEKPVKPVVAQ